MYNVPSPAEPDTSTLSREQVNLVLVRTLPVVHVVVSVVIALFLLQILKRLTADRTNPIAQGVSDGLAFILNG